MVTFEEYDTVVLKADRLFIGIVERIALETYTQPLEDRLIIKHTEVSDDALAEFVNTGQPPRDHVFVRFACATQGSALVKSHDLRLLDRSLNLGDTVKEQGKNILGTIVNVSENYSVQPIWHRSPTKPGTIVTVDEAPGSSPELAVLHNIPGHELKRSDDVIEGDLVVHNDWLGVVDELDLKVVLLLENGSIVVVTHFDELHLPVPDYNKPLVSLPEFDGIPRPDVMVAAYRHSNLIPAEKLGSGQFVVTHERNLRTGRWLHGQYDPTLPAQGRILDVRCRDVIVRWWVPNAFKPDPSGPHAQARSPPSRNMTIYDNISTFSHGTALRQKEAIAIVDQTKIPQHTFDRTRTSPTKRTPIPQKPTVHCSSDFYAGDMVRFRDTTGAALKYQGKFDRILPSEVGGFDVNEMIVRAVDRVASVLWQDGTRTELSSDMLRRFNLFEEDMVPGDLVVAREGMRQCPASTASAVPTLPTDYNEMTFFGSACDLLPVRVGVVQSVDSPERVAQVRWYKRPTIRLTQHGSCLAGTSRFGSISDDVEAVSLYEIMTFPALTRRLRDIVVVAPAAPSEDAFTKAASLRPLSSGDPWAGLACLSRLALDDPEKLSRQLRETAFLFSVGEQSRETTPRRDYRKRPCQDWTGQVVDLSLDGRVTVRINAGGSCQDVVLEHDQILCLVDEAILTGEFDLVQDDMDVEDYGDDVDDDDDDDDDVSASTISETIEYEGGERLDHDSGEENWEDDDEEMVEDGPDEGPQAALNHPRPDDPPLALEPAVACPLEQPHHEEPGEETIVDLQNAAMTNQKPAQFAILEIEPPGDQFQLPESQAPSSTKFLKRITQEHRTLSSSLPQHNIYVRTYESRLDLLRCLIIGPADTPYEFAPFVIDLQLGPKYPSAPPVAHFHSWSQGMGRVNPNLYEDGKICLSLLGTWQGKHDSEQWSERATLLQLLVSLQGLVFVREPFYNEAGFEGQANEPGYVREALQYNEKAFLMSRVFVKHALTRLVSGYQDVVAWTYLANDADAGLLMKIIKRSQKLIQRCEARAADEESQLWDGEGEERDTTRGFLRPLSKGALVHLKKTLVVLIELSQRRGNTQSDVVGLTPT